MIGAIRKWLRRWFLGRYRRQIRQIENVRGMTPVDGAGFGGQDLPAHPRNFRSTGH